MSHNTYLPGSKTKFYFLILSFDYICFQNFFLNLTMVSEKKRKFLKRSTFFSVFVLLFSSCWYFLIFFSLEWFIELLHFRAAVGEPFVQPRLRYWRNLLHDFCFLLFVPVWVNVSLWVLSNAQRYMPRNVRSLQFLTAITGKGTLDYLVYMTTSKIWKLKKYHNNPIFNVHVYSLITSYARAERWIKKSIVIHAYSLGFGVELLF